MTDRRSASRGQSDSRSIQRGVDRHASGILVTRNDPFHAGLFAKRWPDDVPRRQWDVLGHTAGPSDRGKRRDPSSRPVYADVGARTRGGSSECHRRTQGAVAHRGISPQSWLGVGFTAETSGPGRPYVRQTDSFDDAARFVFRDIDDDVIGDMPNLIQSYGAAGYEFDHADPMLGNTDEHNNSCDGDWLFGRCASVFRGNYDLGFESERLGQPVG